MSDIRLYTFGNFYLSSIQQGIQAAHCAVEMSQKYESYDPQDPLFTKWANYDKTMICKNGGAQAELTSIKELFESKDNHLPWDCFNEEESALNCALTCVGIVVPERLHDIGVSVFREKNKEMTYRDDILIVTTEDEQHNYTKFEEELINLIIRSRNAI